MHRPVVVPGGRQIDIALHPATERAKGEDKLRVHRRGVAERSIAHNQQPGQRGDGQRRHHARQAEPGPRRDLGDRLQLPQTQGGDREQLRLERIKIQVGDFARVGTTRAEGGFACAL